ncbi:MAG: CDC48 family AAA ATPase [Candidatus Micrarchaeota archaeon]|nr:CDC48 family AAA ATPase [Candidatus Micrarchaeota archaeon]
MAGKSIELKVAEALQNDVGRGLVRIDSRARRELDVSTGDIVELKGKRSTAALVWQAHPQDEGLNIIRMDGYLRQNTGVGLGDKIVVRKAELKEAKKVVLAPTQPMKYSPGFDQFVKKKMIGRAITRGDTIFIGVFGTSFPLVAAMVQPAGIVIVNENTELVLKEAPEKESAQIATISYEDIGGLKEEVQKIREMVELPLRHPELFERLGIEAPKGVLIYGPPGTGKTLLARAVASESEANFIHIGGPELVSKFVGESEEKMRQIFKDAEENAPSIIFMDEIDAIAPKREEVTGEVERRMVSQLLTLMDGLKARGQVIVIGATNRPNSIDPALRRPGRFDREIELGVPDRSARLEILQIHTRSMPLSEDVKLEEIAAITHGYTGADISSLTKEAAMKVLRRILPKIDLEQEFIPSEILDNLKVTREDFMNALREVRPSGLREVFLEKPNVRWSDIGGLENVKKELKEAVELPLKNPEVFSRIGIRPVKGILLVGLPGTGKTLFAKAVATETEANFISIKGPEVLSKWVGESEKAVREIFRKARMATPCVIFIDEIDAIAPYRGSVDEGNRVAERVVDTLLTEMDGLTGLKNVVVIGATNRPDILDPALMRGGRFDRIIEIPAPDEKARLEIIKIHTRAMPLAKDVDLQEIAKKTEGYTGADLENVCREAGMAAIRRSVDVEEVTAQDFESALSAVKPSVTKSYVEKIKKFAKGDGNLMYR